MTHHRNPVLNGLSLGLLSLALSACDTAPTQVDRHFGMAVRQAQAKQARQPDTRPCRHCAMQAQQRQTEGMPAPMPVVPTSIMTAAPRPLMTSNRS